MTPKQGAVRVIPADQCPSLLECADKVGCKANSNIVAIGRYNDPH
jgi:hypothetical protein